MSGRSAIGFALVLALAGCPGKGGAPGGGATGGPGNDGTAGARVAGPLGTTGFEQLSWGMTEADVRERYPEATVSEDPWSGNPVWTAARVVDGTPAHVEMELERGALIFVGVRFDPTFPTMRACEPAWRAKRAEMDAKLGPSPEENMAAYWTTATADVTLSCDPVVDGADVARVSLRLGPLAED